MKTGLIGRSAVVLSMGLLLSQAIQLSAVYGFTNYANPDATMREARSMRRQGMYPASIKCSRDKSKKYFKPIVKVDWKKNSANREWELYVYRGNWSFDRVNRVKNQDGGVFLAPSSRLAERNSGACYTIAKHTI
jgi:hypothetical protein